MENETNETIIDSTKNNEEVDETTVEKKDVVETTKPKETPEAKRARLQRQLKQVNKELGIEEEYKVSTKKEKKSDDEFGLLEKTYLRSAGITDEDEVSLAKRLKKETGKDLDELIDSKYFKTELEDLRDAKASIEATSGVEGGGSESQAKNTPEYWKAKGVPPTREQVPDRKTRAKIARAMMSSAKSGSKFYND